MVTNLDKDKKQVSNVHRTSVAKGMSEMFSIEKCISGMVIKASDSQQLFAKAFQAHDLSLLDGSCG